MQCRQSIYQVIKYLCNIGGERFQIIKKINVCVYILILILIVIDEILIFVKR